MKKVEDALRALAEAFAEAGVPRDVVDESIAKLKEIPLTKKERIQKEIFFLETEISDAEARLTFGSGRWEKADRHTVEVYSSRLREARARLGAL
jgi:hypothetical protein